MVELLEGKRQFTRFMDQWWHQMLWDSFED